MLTHCVYLLDMVLRINGDFPPVNNINCFGFIIKTGVFSVTYEFNNYIYIYIYIYIRQLLVYEQKWMGLMRQNE